MKLKIVKACTEYEKELICQFRYRIYVEEMGIKALENPQRKIEDILDKKGLLFYAEYNHKVIGTIRYNISFREEKELLDVYDVNSPYFRFYPDFLSTTTRLMVAKEWRNTPLAFRLATTAYKTGLDHQIKYDFISVFPELVHFYERLGYLPFNKKYKKDGNTLIPMCMKLNDLKHMMSINSPLAPILNDYLVHHQIADRG